MLPHLTADGAQRKAEVQSLAHCSDRLTAVTENQLKAAEQQGELRGEITGMRAAVNAISEQFEKFAKQYCEVTAKMGDQVENLTKEVTHSSTRLSSVDQRLASLTTEGKLMEHRIATLTNEYKVLQDSAETAKTLTKENKVLQDQLDAETANNQELKITISDLKYQLAMWKWEARGPDHELTMSVVDELSMRRTELMSEVAAAGVEPNHVLGGSPDTEEHTPEGTTAATSTSGGTGCGWDVVDAQK